MSRLAHRRVFGLLATAAISAAIAFPLGVLASHQFGDVPDSNPYHGDIDAIADAGVTTGCGGGNYCPSAYVTRQEMAAFMNRLGALGPGKTPVVNADKVDGLDSTDFVTTGPVSGHFNCQGRTMLASSSATTWASTGGGRYATSGAGTFYCNLTLPDGATMTAIRATFRDQEATLEGYCSLYRNELGDGSTTGLATTPTTGAAYAAGLITVADETVGQPVVDNSLFSYHAGCLLTGASTTMAVYNVSIEYTVNGPAVP